MKTESANRVRQATLTLSQVLKSALLVRPAAFLKAALAANRALVAKRLFQMHALLAKIMRSSLKIMRIASLNAQKGSEPSTGIANNVQLGNLQKMGSANSANRIKSPQLDRSRAQTAQEPPSHLKIKTNALHVLEQLHTSASIELRAFQHVNKVKCQETMTFARNVK